MSPSVFTYLNGPPLAPHEPYAVAENKAPISAPPSSNLLIYEFTAVSLRQALRPTEWPAELVGIAQPAMRQVLA